jgi:hypothetical protein
MKYLILIKHAESLRSATMPPEFLDKVGRFVTDGFASGALKDTAGLKPTSEGFRVRSAGGRLHVTDGPFTEAKEIVGGYAMIDVASRDEALEFAREFMDLHREHFPEFEGECEVRPLENM